MWTGFSSEEIKKLHSSLEKSEQKDEIDPVIDGDFQFEEPLVLFPIEPTELKQLPKMKMKAVQSLKSQAQNKCLNPTGARLIQLSEELSNTTDTHIGSSAAILTCRNSSGSQGNSRIQVAEDKYKVTSSSENNESLTKDDSIELNEEENVALSYQRQKGFLIKADESPVVQDRCTLEQFHERQKLMEEQNKRKKDLLIKAIADRKRRTQSEAQKILQIQDELNRLDSLLSTDVSILRNQIEAASIEFNEAQKRFDRVENEFIQAKIHLFSKLERKELLTEHLCRIIEVNEQRKAKKLSELLAKLEISDEKSSLNCLGVEAPPVFPSLES